MAIHSIREHYPEAKTWVMQSSHVIGGALIRIYEITTYDGAHFVEAFITQGNDTVTLVRIHTVA